MVAPPAVAEALPLAGRTAIVTGASRGIGRTIAAHLSSLGADVLIGFSSSPAEAESLATEINSFGSSSHCCRAVVAKADISEEAGAKSLFDSAEAAFGRQAHILVASAGIMDDKYTAIADTTAETFDRIIAVNTRGAFFCCREAANRLVGGDGGRVVLLSTSLVGLLRPGYGAYVASKAAVEAMVKILAKELKGTAIKAYCVAPGPVATATFFAGKTAEQLAAFAEANSLGRIGDLDDIAPVVAFLCTDVGGWVNGQVVRANDGLV